nr:acyloxyacyl hydrolase [Cytophagales bacterium]
MYIVTFWTLIPLKYLVEEYKLMPVKPFILIPLFFLVIIANNYAQHDSGIRYRLDGQYGFIIPHAADLVEISQSNPVGISLGFDKISFVEKNWKNCHCFYYLGVNLSHFSYNNPEVLGSATALSGTFEPILWKFNKIQLNLRSSFGVAYLSRVYDTETNPSNTFFSSPISFLLAVSPTLQWHLRDDLALNLSFNYNHISNGGQKQPNRGMNFPMLGVGMSYLPKPISLPKYAREKPNGQRFLYLEAYGTLRGESTGDNRQPLLGVTFGGVQRIGSFQGLGAGFESQWDNSLLVGANQRNRLIHAPFLSHHFLFGRVDFGQRFGVYVQKPDIYEPDKLFYQRYTLSYLLKNAVRIGVALKAHGHVAENIEVRLGYQF